MQNKKTEGTGEWAWARFFLKHDAAAFSAARASHDKGDLLGSFILLKCYRNGIGVKKDDQIKDKLNTYVRTKLTMKKAPLTAIDSYMLAYLLPDPKTGPTIEVNEGFVGRAKSVELIGGKSRWEHLSDSAEAGFAQALDEVGTSMQNRNLAQAVQYFEIAAKSGLASSMKNLGILYALSPQMKDAKQAKKWTEKSAQAGDVYGMINMAALADRKIVDNISAKEARKWIEAAAVCGHPAGLLEKGVSHFNGKYGIPVDAVAGKALLQKAADGGDSSSLGKISYLYQTGTGLDKNLKLAAKFAEAAYVQGDVSGPTKLELIYRTLLATDPSVATKRKYWEEVAKGLSPTAPEITGELKKIDPFSLKVE